MPIDISQMAKMLSMIAPVANKSNPLQQGLNPSLGTEGGGRAGNARGYIVRSVNREFGSETVTKFRTEAEAKAKAREWRESFDGDIHYVEKE
jgi:hypothetical protein